jgi:hypothetical protein
VRPRTLRGVLAVLDLRADLIDDPDWEPVQAIEGVPRDRGTGRRGMSATTVASSEPDEALITAETEFRELLAGYDRVTDWTIVESIALVRRLKEVKALIMGTPPKTLAGAAVKLRVLLEMLQRDWDDHLSKDAHGRYDAPALRQVITLIERETQS